MTPNFASGFDPSALRAARQTAGLSIDELAQRMGRDYTAVARWESGARTPQIGTLAQLATALGIEVSRLTGAPSTLAELRVSRGLSQAQVAQALGVAQPRYANLEQGKVMLRADQVVTLARLFDCTGQLILDLAVPR